ncbi:MAG: hypothetical protein ACSLE9_15075 [Burkholderiaceae bacterium]
MLFRAIAYAIHPYGSSIDDECVVFFESPSVPAAGARLATLLSEAWSAPKDCIEAYNVRTEHELLSDWAFGDASTGDARLFEVSCGPNGIGYVEAARTLVLVRPATLRRLAQARELVTALQRAQPLAQCAPVVAA